MNASDMTPATTTSPQGKSAAAQPQLGPTEDPRSPALLAGVDYRQVPNGTERVTEHLRPGRTRAPFLRYIRINLPRTTRLVLVLVIAVIGASAVSVALSDRLPYPFATPVLWLLAAAAACFVVLGLLTRWRIWLLGLGIAVVEILSYCAGIFGQTLFVWNGATIVQAAIWNVGLMAAVGYVVLFWALKYGMIVAYPDDQGFLD